MYKSGKSKSEREPFGVRRKKEDKPLAPKSLRKKGKQFLSDCSEEEKIKAGILEKS